MLQIYHFKFKTFSFGDYIAAKTVRYRPSCRFYFFKLSGYNLNKTLRLTIVNHKLRHALYIMLAVCVYIYLFILQSVGGIKLQLYGLTLI
jgi:hypothetical protein